MINDEEINIDSFIDENVIVVSTRTLAKIVKRAKLKCSICGWDECACDIHHILPKKQNGTNDLENLVCLCPNCHRKAHNNLISIEELKNNSFKTFDWKPYYRTQRVQKITARKILTAAAKDSVEKISRNFGIKKEIVEKIIKEKKKYIKKGRSLKFEVSKEDLEKLVNEKPMTEIGKMFGVSDNAVKKRCKKLGIELKPMLGYWTKKKYGKE